MTNRRTFLGGMIISSLLVVSTLFVSGQAHAAGSAISLTTSPISIDLTAKPGSTVTKTLQLRNNTSQPLQMHVELQVFGPQGSTGEAAITNAKAGDPSPSWVHFSPSSFIAQPGAWSQVQMTINLPQTAQLGYYYAVIFKPEVPVQPTAPKTNIVKGSNAILVLLDTKSPNENRQVQIANFSATKKLYEYLPATFNVSIHNGGNIYLPVTGNIFISRSSKLTNTIATLNVNAGGGLVLPNSNRNFKAVWADGFPAFQTKTAHGQPVTDSKGQPIESLKWDSSKSSHFRFGKYYAQLALQYNNGQRPVLVTSVISFWVIPWKLLIVALIILILVGLGVWSISRNIIRKVKPGHKKP